MSTLLCDETNVGMEFQVSLKPSLTESGWFEEATEAIGMICAGSGITPALQVSF
jgi:ferredoxin-NADP reductase